MAFNYDQVFAADPANPSNVAASTAVTIFAPGDTTQAPLVITDPSGGPLANPIIVNANGFGSAFQHATLDRVAWAGGGFTGFLTSYEGMKQVAVDAQAAAESAAANAAGAASASLASAVADADTAATSAANSATAAAASAALVGAPADPAIAAAIKGASSETKEALSAAYGLNVAAYVGSATGDVTAQVAQAVADAYTQSRPLHWDTRAYTTTATIPNLHKVRHTGKGWIVRGVNIFYVNPSYSQSNILYADPAGLSTNDGLTPSQPMNRLSTIFTAWTNYGPVLQGTWSAQLATGTINDQAVTGQKSVNRIWIYGAPVAAGATPTTVFDPGATGFTKAIAATDYVNIGLKDIKAQNYLTAESPAFDFVAHCNVALVNVHASGNDMGFRFMNHTKYSADGCVSENNTQYGILELFSVVRDFKAGGTTRPTILRGNGKVGIKSKELCTGHLDGAQIYDNMHGVHFSRSCTANGTSAQIYRNQYGVTLRNQSSFVPLSVDWKFGTADKNTVTPWDVEASSSFVSNENEATVGKFSGRGEKLLGSYAPDPAFIHTGTTTATTIATFGNLRQGSLARAGGYVRTVILGSKGGTTGTATLDFRFGGSSAGSVVIPAPAVTAFKIEITVFSLGPAKQTVAIVTTVPGVADSRVSRTYDVDAADYLLSLRGTLVSAGDSLTIAAAWCYTTEALATES